MMFSFNSAKSVVCVTLIGLALLSTGGCIRRKYENPISKDTKQPDKVLFDKAVADIERGRYEVARITLQTLMNTYDTSEFLAKSKLAIADSWFREGGSHGMAQAEAEYKDFILFYPTMEESAEAQEKVCLIHVKQMEKPDRDDKHASKAEEECRLLLTQFPNSKFAPQAQQLLRNIQEDLAEKEMRVGAFYHNKGSHPAASNRLQALTDQYPLYSQSDQALWTLAASYSKMGPKFKQKSLDAYAKIVKDYPLSKLVDEAKKKLTAAEAQIPEADPVALARMKYEKENATKATMLHNFWQTFTRGPDTIAAAKSGTPALTSLRPTIPASVPTVAPPNTSTTDVGATVLPATGGALDTNPDARQTLPAKPGEPAAEAEKKPDVLPSNLDGKGKPIKKKKEKVSKKTPVIATPAKPDTNTDTKPSEIK